MNMLTTLAPPVAAIAMVAWACSSTTTPPGPSTGGANCTAMPGEFPNATCEISPNECGNFPTGCVIDEAVCGNKTTCMPTANNAGKATVDLRIRRLNVTMPYALSSRFIMQKAIIDQGINLKAPECGENGDGSFNWLLRVDKSKKTMTTGGAPPSGDSFGVGFCFANTVSPSGIRVVRATANITYDGDAFTSDKIPKLNMPIFSGGDPTRLFILPLSQVRVKDVTLSADQNCVGGFDYDHVHSDCSDVREQCSRWHTSGAIGGFITLEDADSVALTSLGTPTLCVVLNGSTPGPDGVHCARDASHAITPRGDYCSTTDSVGGCADSYWFAATFAAAAVNISDGASDPNCNGSTVLDAGGSD